MTKRGDKLKPGTPEWNRRQERWIHNSYLGHVKMAKSNMLSIQKAKTTTALAKDQAEVVWFALDQLEVLIQERVK